MRTVRRSRRLSTHNLPDALDQCVPGGFDYLDIGYPEPPIIHPVATSVSHNLPLSPRTIESLSAFADQRELPPPDLHSQVRRRKGKNGNAPRPPNAFMLFRSDFWRFNKESINERDHRWISRIAAVCWNTLPEPRRIPYQDRARKLKDEHAQLYPQHKYNLSAKDRARKKVKEEIDDDELCDVLAARVAQDVRASMSPKTPGSSQSGLLNQVMERKVNLKRSRSDSAAEGASKGGSQPSGPPVKKRKRNPPKPSTNTVPVSETQSQIGLSYSSIPSFVPTNEIPVLALPPTVKRESPQAPVLDFAAHTVLVKKEPTLSMPPMVGPSKGKAPELEVLEAPAMVSLQFSPIAYEPPVQYLPEVAETVVDKGLQFFMEYGMARLMEGIDYSSFYNLGDASASAGTFEGDDEFAQWCSNYSY